MASASLGRDTVARRFGRAAASYDQAALVQAQVAGRLVGEAVRRLPAPPGAILDIGCGTGFVAAMAARHWPQAEITAVDGASSMLQQARRKVPSLRLIAGDIAAMEFGPAFDLILSSMTLHWLPQPRLALKRWRGWLGPQGRMHVALLAEGSFREWRDLCVREGLADGLWPMPRADFADGLVFRAERQTIPVAYPSAIEFLRRLKALGGTMPRPGHRPFAPFALRRLLSRAPRPFTASYEVLYLEAGSSTI